MIVAVEADGGFAGGRGVGGEGRIAACGCALGLAIGSGSVEPSGDVLAIGESEIAGTESFDEMIGDSEVGGASSAVGAEERLSGAPGVVIEAGRVPVGRWCVAGVFKTPGGVVGDEDVGDGNTGLRKIKGTGSSSDLGAGAPG